MRIGIMTWYKYHNYGSVLQATALYTMINKLGYKPVMINYEPKGVTRAPRNLYHTTKEFIYQSFNSVTGNVFSDRYKKEFDEFINQNLDETPFCNSYVELKELSKEIDSFVCGSDQIWSPLVFDDKYFLNFSPESKIVSYAPSIGLNEIKDNIIKNKIAKLIKRFDNLSIREETGQKIIKDITGKEAKVVLDPTLLLDYGDWANYENKDILTKIDKNFILCYFLGDSNKYLKQIERYAKENNLTIYNIPYYRKKKINKYNIEEAIGPAEFIALIKNAKCVFTDSFHGTIFSINFNKNFYTYRRFTNKDIKNQNSRVVNILDKFNLSDRLVDRNMLLNNKKIDYSLVNKKLSKLRKESISFLDKSLLKTTASKLISDDKITNYCCGCGSCAAVCPVDAIKIITNDEGFQHYKIDDEKCINCGMCQKVCPMLHLDTIDIKKAVRLYSFKNGKVLDKSSSGGFSYSLSEVFNNSHYICGVEYDNTDDVARHIIIKPNNNEELSKIQGSKYIQSNSSKVLKEILNIGKKNKVVFFGTPCQVAGLDKILKIKSIRNNFILVDIICHGVPTKYLWNKYLTEKCSLNKISLTNHKVNFRDKSSTWRERRITIQDDKHKYTKTETKDDFYSIFKRGTCNMNSCYECPYRQKSSADIRIGDYWGNRFIRDKSGVSMVITITEKGDSILKKMNAINKYEINEYSLNEFWTVQYPLNQQVPTFRQELISDLKNGDISIHKIRKKYHRCDDISAVVAKLINKIRVK